MPQNGQKEEQEGAPVVEASEEDLASGLRRMKRLMMNGYDVAKGEFEVLPRPVGGFRHPYFPQDF